MVFDEPTGDYKPRFGYKRGRDESSEWLYELKGNDKCEFVTPGGPGIIRLIVRGAHLPFTSSHHTSDQLTRSVFFPDTAVEVDHIERRELEKKRRVVNNKMNQATNMERAAYAEERKKGSSSGTRDFSAPSDGKVEKRTRPSAPAGIPSIPISEGRVDVLAGPGKHARSRPTDTKAVKRAQISMAQVSTASMGKVSFLSLFHLFFFPSMFRLPSLPPHANIPLFFTTPPPPPV